MDTSSSDSEDSSVYSDDSSFDFSDSEESSDNEEEDELSQMSSQMSLFDDDVVSDDDGCDPPCHWSSTQPDFEHVALNPFLNEDNVFGKPSQPFPEGTSACGVVLSIVTDSFLDLCVNATFEYGSTDPHFRKHLGDIFADHEKAKAFMLGFFAVRWHLGLLGLPNYRWAWQTDDLRHQPAISKIMTMRQHQLMLRYFRCVHKDRLPTRGSAHYHPLQNIMAGVDILQANCVELWQVGRMLCIDEGEIKIYFINPFEYLYLPLQMHTNCY